MERDKPKSKTAVGFDVRNEQVDLTETYVLEETAITKVKSIEELAELAMSQETAPIPDSRREKPPRQSS